MIVLALGAIGAVIAVQAAGRVIDDIQEEAGQVTNDVIDAVNPASDKNLIYLAANYLTQKATGNNQDTLGTAIYRWTH